MLITLKEALGFALKNRLAIGAFNTPTLESLDAVIEAAEELGLPVIVSHAELHESIAPLSAIGPVMVLKARLASVPVVVHLDHGEHLPYLEEAIRLGFTSVMFDGSLLPYEENVRLTKKAVSFAHARGVSVEAEIGALPSREDGSKNDVDPSALYTDPALAKAFVEETGIDALAASFGTAHGIYRSAPKLDFPRIEEIQRLAGIPLVMHGGSGVSPEDYRKAIDRGIAKINYYSYMAKAGTEAAAELIEKERPVFFHDVAFAAKQAMKEDAKKAMLSFANGFIR